MTLFPGCLTDSRYRCIYVSKISAHHSKELFAWSGQGHVAGSTIKEPETQLVLQLTDQNAQTGRRYVESLRRPGKALMLRGHNKRTELSKQNSIIEYTSTVINLFEL